MYVSVHEVTFRNVPMPSRHNKFVHAENIREFQQRLDAETDPEKRKLIATLLAEDEALKLPHPSASARDDNEA